MDELAKLVDDYYVGPGVGLYTSSPYCSYCGRYLGMFKQDWNEYDVLTEHYC